MPARIDLRRLVAALLVPGAALAEPLHWPDAAAITRALEQRPFPSLARLAAEPRRAVPSPRAGDTPPGTLDLEALARHGATLSNPAATALGAPALQIFITLDMPAPSLERLVDQAARAGATLVLRGLKAESLRATLAAVKPLLESHQVAWVIDPQAFARFDVTVAPTFVLTLPTTTPAAAPGACDNAEAPRKSFVSVAGDVSLDYALEALAKRNPAARSQVAAVLERLRKS